MISEPHDLFFPANLPVLESVAADTLRYGETVGDDPAEASRLKPC
jgi:hypothetical protein